MVGGAHGAASDNDVTSSGASGAPAEMHFSILFLSLYCNLTNSWKYGFSGIGRVLALVLQALFLKINLTAFEDYETPKVSTRVCTKLSLWNLPGTQEKKPKQHPRWSQHP